MERVPHDWRGHGEIDRYVILDANGVGPNNHVMACHLDTVVLEWRTSDYPYWGVLLAPQFLVIGGVSFDRETEVPMERE
jgi:hypothetical protein